MLLSSFAARAQAVLRTAGLYDRAKASILYDIYWRIVDRRIIDGRDAEVAFYREHLRGFQPGDRIFDIGANQGYKTDIFLRLGANIIAVEPDRHSQEILRKRFLVHRFRKRPVIIVGMAASHRDGVETLWLDEPGSAKNTLSTKWVDTLRTDDSRFGTRLTFGHQQQIETVCLDTLITKYGAPFFVKVDVEGHELEILRGLRCPIPYLSFEVNLPEFGAEGRQCVELLATLQVDGLFNYSVDCRHGLVLDKWLEQRAFLSVFNNCSEKSIEVFWKTVE